MQTLQFYTRADCELCHSALAVVKRVQKKIPFRLEEVDIDSDAALSARYGNVIPVVVAENQELARSFIDEKMLLEKLRKRTASD